MTREDFADALARFRGLPKLASADAIVGVGVLDVNGQDVRGVLYADGRFVPSPCVPDEPLRMLKTPMEPPALELIVPPVIGSAEHD